MYKLNNTNLVNIPKIINLEYTINKVVSGAPATTTYNITINLSSKFKIPMSTSIEFFIDGITYVSSRINNILNATSGTKITNLSIDGHKGILTLNGDVEPMISQIFTANNIGNLSFLDSLVTTLNKKIIINF